MKISHAVMLAALAGYIINASTSHASSGLCNLQAAQSLVGKLKPNDDDATRLTGATIVRQIAPGQPVTEDYRENRVTVETDPATGRVVRAVCG